MPPTRLLEPSSIAVIDHGGPDAARRALAAARQDLVPPEAGDALARAATGRTPWPVYLYGPPGTGKTMAALYALRRAGGMFLSASKWAQHRVRPDEGYGDAAVVMERMGTIEGHPRNLLYRPLVVVDEIGLRETRATEWQIESLLLLLNARYGLPLIVTGNLTPEKVGETYDGRIQDRLCSAGTAVPMTGRSQRDWRTP